MNSLQHSHEKIHPYLIIMQIHHSCNLLIYKEFLVQVCNLFAPFQAFLWRRNFTAVHHYQTAPESMAKSVSSAVFMMGFREFFICDFKGSKSRYKGKKSKQRMPQQQP